MQRTWVGIGLVLVVVAAGCAGLEPGELDEGAELGAGLRAKKTRTNADAGTTSTTADAGTTVVTGWQFERATTPPGMIVRDAAGQWLATFTDGARTVRVAGPLRTFSEATAANPVDGREWVRVLPAPFTGIVDEAWLGAALTDGTPDVLAIAMQYVDGAPELLDATGLRIAGDADYGPLQADGTRQEGSDFNDFLGVTWTYPDGTRDAPESLQYGSLDCSGFQRMVWGDRAGVPLALSELADRTALPRRAVQMESGAPGVVVVANAGVQVTDLSLLAPGDLVFFDASTDDGTAIDHVGVYLGRDRGGRARFLSSRKSANGPTMGDTVSLSLLDGTGFYARALRSIRRL